MNWIALSWIVLFVAVPLLTGDRKVRYRRPEPDQSPRDFLRTFYRAQRAELERRLVMGKRKSDKRDGVS